MIDEGKTRNQLINEIIRLRQQIIETEKSKDLRKQSNGKLLQESEDRYKSIIEQINDCVYIMDAETKQILQANQTFQRLFGYNSDEVAQLNIYDILNYERENIDDMINNLFKAQNYFFGEISSRRKDGTFLDMEISITHIPNENRNVLCLIAHDITERKRRDEEIKNRINELQNFYDMAIGRELKMIKLKKKIEELKEQIEKYEKL
jgi:PAS domain S-box-containing protein